MPELYKSEENAKNAEPAGRQAGAEPGTQRAGKILPFTVLSVLR
jgi:hypothetical protein